MQVRKRVRKMVGGTKVLWECDLGKINGKRVAICFRTRKEAEARLAEERERVKQFGRVAYSFTEADKHRFAAARERLALAGATIEQAVDFYLAEHKPLKEPISLAALLGECVLAKELAGCRARYLGQFGVSCRSFVRSREETLVTAVTREDVARWVAGNGWAPKTQRVYLGDLRVLFSYALEQKYLAKNPAAGKFAIPQEEAKEIEALSVEQVKALLALAVQIPGPGLGGRKTFDRPPLLWYLVLGLYCGIRPEELARMNRGMVSLEERHAIVPARIAKTRKRRVVDLPENAIAWLERDPLREGPVRPKNFRLLWGRLRFAAGFIEHNHTRAKLSAAAASPDPASSFPASAAASVGILFSASNEVAKSNRPVKRVPWPHDAMRHTYASMHYAHHQDEAALKAQMGHSDDEDTLMQHYRALKTRREAEEFWALRP